MVFESASLLEAERKRLANLSTKALRAECRDRGVDTCGIIERGGYVDRLLLTLLPVGANVEDSDWRALKFDVSEEQFEYEFLKAVEQHDLCKVEESLDLLRRGLFGCDINTADFVLAFDESGNTILHRCLIGSEENEEGLTESNVDLVAEVASALLAAGADLNATNLLGETPLLSSCRAGHSLSASAKLAKLLLEHSADPNQRDSLEGETPLMEAASRGDSELCRLLLVARADVNSQSTAGRTALDFAVEAGQRVAATVLSRAMSEDQEVAHIEARGRSDCIDSPRDGRSAEGESGDWTAGLVDCCKEIGLPVEATSISAAKKVFADLDRWQIEGVKRLCKECVRRGIPTSGCVEREDLLERLRKVRVWEELPIALLQAKLRHLQQVEGRSGSGACDVEDPSHRSGKGRQWLLQQLVEAAFGPPTHADEARSQTLGENPYPSRGVCEGLQSQIRGVDVSWFPDSSTLEKAKRRLLDIQQLSVGELKRRVEGWGLSSKVFTDKQDLVAVLQDAAVWELLPEEKLKQVCKDCQVSTTGARKDMIQHLMGVQVPAAPESRFKNFFSYGFDKSSANFEQHRAAGGNFAAHKSASATTRSGKTTTFDKDGIPLKHPPPNASIPSMPPGQGSDPEFDRAWRSQADENRRQFMAGNRNHAGMATGQRRAGGPAPAGWRAKFNAPPSSGYGQKVPERTSKNLQQCYAVLGLGPGASQPTVRKAYRQLALKYHPDKNPGKLKELAETRFREITKAYDELCDYFRRSAT